MLFIRTLYFSNEESVVDNHCYQITTKFTIGIKDNHESQCPTIYWLPSLRKRRYRAASIASSSSSITTDLPLSYDVAVIQ